MKKQIAVAAAVLALAACGTSGGGGSDGSDRDAAPSVQDKGSARTGEKVLRADMKKAQEGTKEERADFVLGCLSYRSDNNEDGIGWGPKYVTESVVAKYDGKVTAKDVHDVYDDMCESLAEYERRAKAAKDRKPEWTPQYQDQDAIDAKRESMKDF